MIYAFFLPVSACHHSWLSRQGLQPKRWPWVEWLSSFASFFWNVTPSCPRAQKSLLTVHPRRGSLNDWREVVTHPPSLDTPPPEDKMCEAEEAHIFSSHRGVKRQNPAAAAAVAGAAADTAQCSQVIRRLQLYTLSLRVWRHSKRATLILFLAQSSPMVAIMSYDFRFWQPLWPLFIVVCVNCALLPALCFSRWSRGRVHQLLAAWHINWYACAGQSSVCSALKGENGGWFPFWGILLLPLFQNETLHLLLQ